jgi:hypothetical protein
VGRERKARDKRQVGNGTAERKMEAVFRYILQVGKYRKMKLFF